MRPSGSMQTQDRPAALGGTSRQLRVGIVATGRCTAASNARSLIESL